MPDDQDDFETAVDEVNGTVTTLRKARVYELPPKGLHKGLCIEAKLREKDFQGHTSTVLGLTWELETTYEDNGETKKFRIWDDLSLFYGPKARLNKTFKELTGEDIEPLVTKKKIKQDGVDYIQEIFQFQAFEGMAADITVVHKEGKADPSKVYANVGAYTCQPDVQKKNASLVFDDAADSKTPAQK